MQDQLLFAKYDIFSVLENQKRLLREKIRSAPKEWLAQEAMHLERAVDEFALNVPELNEAGIEISQKEVDVDVSRDPARMIFDRSRPVYLKGLRVTFHVPFSGDAGLFDVQPSTFTLNPPRGNVQGHELLFVYEVLEDRLSGVEGSMKEQLAKVKTYLGNMKPSADTLRQELTSIANSEWQTRKSSFVQREAVIQSLGFPIRQTAQKPPSSPDALQATPSTVSTRRESRPAPNPEWDVFISHASEDKNSVARPLASALISEGLRVWFDETALTLGDSLRRKIDEGLARSRFGVVILSKNFFAKHWPQQELNGLVARESASKKVILPVWHQVDQEYVTNFSPTLADKLAVRTDAGIEHVAAQIAQVCRQLHM